MKNNKDFESIVYVIAMVIIVMVMGIVLLTTTRKMVKASVKAVASSINVSINKEEVEVEQLIDEEPIPLKEECAPRYSDGDTIVKDNMIVVKIAGVLKKDEVALPNKYMQIVTSVDTYETFSDEKGNYDFGNIVAVKEEAGLLRVYEGETLIFATPISFDDMEGQCEEE